MRKAAAGRNEVYADLISPNRQLTIFFKEAVQFSNIHLNNRNKGESLVMKLRHMTTKHLK